jgi:hypothetical protein
MAVKSIIDVEMNDEAFKRFNDLFNQYRAKLAETPAAVGAVNEEIKNSEVGYSAVVAAIFAQTQVLNSALTAQQKYNKEVDKSAHSWSTIAKTTKSAVADIIAGTTAILRFASLGGALSGLLGIGGIFGLDKLGQGVSNARRTAQGVGASIGEQQALNLSFGRYIDTQGLTGGINDALTDPAKRFALIGLGASQSDIAGGDSVKIANDVLPNLKKLADQTPTEFLAPALQARGLQGVFSPEDLRRLKSLSPEEFQAAQAQNSEYAKKLTVTDADARAWQDFVTQLKLAGQEIENILVKGLAPLAAPLKDLSKAFADVVAVFLQAAKDQGWIQSISAGLEEFAKYIGTQDFRDNIKEFVDDVALVAKAMVNALKWLGVIPDKDAKPSDGKPALEGQPSYIGPDMGVDPLHPFARGGRHNVGNLRNPNGSGFQTFANDDDGVRAIAKQLQIYQDRDHLDTIREIESRYSPANENDTQQLIKNAVNQTGYGPDQHLDLHDKTQLAAIVAAITKQEGVKSYSPGAVVTIMNQTGGNTIVTTSQLPQ